MDPLLYMVAILVDHRYKSCMVQLDFACKWRRSKKRQTTNPEEHCI